MTARLHHLPLFAVLASALPLAGCGNDGPAAPAQAATPAPRHARYLGDADLERSLANGFRDGLYRLAVMSQPRDDAADLGQDLPTGTLEHVGCDAGGARPASAQPWPWRCSVRWRTVDGATRLTRYDVQLLPSGCFAAGATPRLAPHRDATIASYSEHPLNAIVSVREGC